MLGTSWARTICCKALTLSERVDIASAFTWNLIYFFDASSLCTDCTGCIVLQLIEMLNALAHGEGLLLSFAETEGTASWHDSCKMRPC